MKTIKHLKAADIETQHKDLHPGYEFIRRSFLPQGEAKRCVVAIYEIPPGKSAFPYHYHVKNEEVYYILSGTGLLKTPEGDKTVCQGEFLYFPANESGAHKLTNTSKSEPLTYIDFDTQSDLEVAVYPDSGKIGIWGMDINEVYCRSDEKDYYEGE